MRHARRYKAPCVPTPGRSPLLVRVDPKVRRKLALLCESCARAGTRLSPPTFHYRNDASTQHDNNDDGGERLRRGQGLVPVIPKLEHALVSIESAPSTEKISIVSKGRASATKNAMLRFVARVLIARQHVWAGWWLARERRRGGA